MLNKTELFDLAKEIAKAFKAFEQQNNRGKTTYSNLVQDALKSQRLRDFIEVLTQILEYDKSKAEFWEGTVKQLLVLPVDILPLFFTLVRFEYQIEIR